ncbi:MAG: von Willebrand factor type A domain-containing protein, partial [Burkholderiales bacterium]|nr:von Willebrand factor type A domain-containing protein [Burkholderiales bacterium]
MALFLSGCDTTSLNGSSSSAAQNTQTKPLPPPEEEPQSPEVTPPPISPSSVRAQLMAPESHASATTARPSPALPQMEAKMREDRDAAMSARAVEVEARRFFPAREVSPQPYYQDVPREQYETLSESEIKSVASDPVSTFSIDVDTGAYANVRRFLNNGQLPPHGAVRVEELINY